MKSAKKPFIHHKKICLVLMAISFFMVIFIIVKNGIQATHAEIWLEDKPISIDESSYTVIHERQKTPRLYTDYPRKDFVPFDIYVSLPEKKSADTSHVMFSHSKSWVRMWVDDNLIYSFYPEKDNDKYDHPVSTFHLAMLPEEWEGKELRILIIPATKESSTLFPEIFLGSHGSLILHALIYALPKAILCAVLGSIAIFIFIISSIRGIKEKVGVRRQTRAFSYFLFDIAIWAILETRIRAFIIHNIRLSECLVIISFLLIPLLLANFLNTFDFFSKERSFKVLYYWVFIQFLILSAGYIMGAASETMELLTQITIGVLILYMVASIGFANASNSMPMELSALCKSSVWLLIGFVAEIVHFYFCGFMQRGVFIILSLMIFSVQSVYYTLRNIINDSIEAVTEHEKMIVNLEEERVRSMMTQMNPHFLYNALTSIQAIVKTDPDYAFDMIRDFSKHLRSTLKELTVEKISFMEEMENVKAFMNLEKMRFGDRLNIEYRLDCTHFDVIPLCVQPLVENSCRHGLFPKGKKGGTVIVKSYEEQDCYVIQVIDDGVGFDIEKYLEEATKGIHIGIYNVKYRLKKVLNADLDFVSSPEMGTVATIEIPKQGIEQGTITAPAWH